MFGLTFDKMLVVALLAAVVLGPSRLPLYAHQLARTFRAFRDLVEKTRSTAEDELGVSLDRTTWESLDLQQYDPRRIVREALHDNDPAPHAVPDPEVLAEAERVRPGQKYLVTGSAAHPRRIRLESLPDDDPRRVAARRQVVTRPENNEHARRP